MTLYIKKPVAIEAIQFKGRYMDDKELLAKLSAYPFRLMGQTNLQIQTLSGWQPAVPGDYIIFGTHDAYPCKEEVFTATYEPVIEA